VTSFVERMQKAKNLELSLQSELAKQAAQALKERVYPAYARMTAALELQRPAAATQGAGVGSCRTGRRTTRSA